MATTVPVAVPLTVPARSRPLLVGYYGEHNLGDDALLEVLLDQLPAGLEPTVTAKDQGLLQRRYGVATVDRTRLPAVLGALGRSDALVFGGGSLLQDATSFASLAYYVALVVAARAQGKPVLLWGQGLGPLRRRASRWLVRAVLPLITAATWRDDGSAALARRLGGRQAPVGADPVWAVAPEPWRGQGGPVVVCLRPTAQLQAEAWLPWLAALDRLAPQRDVIWLPFHAHQDRGLLASLRGQGLLTPALAARSREVTVSRPRDAMDLLASAGLVVAMRLHGLILAAAAGAPTVALSYDPKVAAAAASLGCLCTPLESPPPADLAEQWTAWLDRPAPRPRQQALRESTAVHRQLLTRLLC